MSPSLKLYLGNEVFITWEKFYISGGATKQLFNNSNNNCDMKPHNRCTLMNTVHVMAPLFHIFKTSQETKKNAVRSFVQRKVQFSKFCFTYYVQSSDKTKKLV